MKIIILAAGYATRLYPLTLNRAKPLLDVAGKPMIERVLDNLKHVEDLTRVYVVTNAKFAAQFRSWAEGYGAGEGAPGITIVNDNSTSDANKLGAIGDLHLVLTQEGVEDEVIVVAGDNLLSHGLEAFGEFSRRRDAPVVAVYDVGDLEAIKKYNSIETEEDGRVTLFEEKPANPVSTLTAIALYYYPQSSLPLIRQYIAEGNNRDQPGRLVEWMYKRTPYYTWQVPGIWYDIGSKETLEEANRIFAKGV